MNTTNESKLLFFQGVGQLFYAIAAADKVVRKAEFEALSSLVTTEWSSLEGYKDKFGTDAIHQIEIVFDWLKFEELDTNDCFESFKDYFESNKTQFSIERKKLIWKTANAIASAFAGKNKSEVILLTRLKLLFEK